MDNDIDVIFFLKVVGVFILLLLIGGLIESQL